MPMQVGEMYRWSRSFAQHFSRRVLKVRQAACAEPAVAPMCPALDWGRLSANGPAWGGMMGWMMRNAALCAPQPSNAFCLLRRAVCAFASSVRRSGGHCKIIYSLFDIIFSSSCASEIFFIISIVILKPIRYNAQCANKRSDQSPIVDRVNAERHEYTAAGRRLSL